MNSFESLVSLNLMQNAGSGHLSRLLERFGCPEEIFRAGFGELEDIAGTRLAGEITSFDRNRLDEELARAKKCGASVITFLDRGYPLNLKEIPGFPIVLYVLGEMIEKDIFSLGIVGSRRGSAYGLTNAEKFAGELAADGMTIISGLARGVDTCAHRGALKARGRTIAVIGSGFNHIYPAENASLAEQISGNGAVISEFPMDTMPLARNFPRRNRLISGLSLGVLVVEAAKNSGALITADFALEQGRDVFALPGRIDSLYSSGANELIKQGAKLVTRSEEILEELGQALPSGKKAPAEARAMPEDAQEAALYGYIGNEAVSIDNLIGKMSLPSGRMASLILNLRFKKMIRELPGKQFVRS